MGCLGIISVDKKQPVVKMVKYMSSRRQSDLRKPNSLSFKTLGAATFSLCLCLLSVGTVFAICLYLRLNDKMGGTS